MTQIYGTAFLTLFGETPNPLWVSQIALLTDDECRAGLGKLAAESRQFPANLTEFTEACKPKPQGVRYLGRPTTPGDVLRLPAPKASRDVAERYLARMREALKRAGV